MAYLLGLDVGTTGAKALLVNPEGKVVASATNEYPMFTPQPLWSEQNPEDWWKATQRSFKRVLAQADVKPDEVAGIGLTGQMHGLVLLDASGKVLRPCIMWNDQRTASQCASITEKIGRKRLMELTGNPVLPGFTAPKILWVREHEPEIYRQIAHILLPKDFIRYRLTGEFATDVSDASGTSLLDVRNRQWSKELLNLLEIPERWMPQLYESPDVTGQVTFTAVDTVFLKPGIAVVAGAGDQAAGAVGSGIVVPGFVSVTLGTSGVVFAHTDQLVVEREGRLHAFCHAVPGKWHIMGVTLAAGGSLRWFRDTLGQPEQAIARTRSVDPYEVLVEEAAKAPPGSDGLIFLPYLSGERTPYPDPYARGSFIGLTVRHSKSHMVRAVLEGVAYSLRDCLELTKSLGLEIKEVRVSGGGARSVLWRQILADVCHVELVTMTSTEGASYGAALLAGVGTKVYPDVIEACRNTIHVSNRTIPDSARSNIYENFYRIYRHLYPALKSAFTLLGEIQPS